ncbi:MAG: C-GCAxxG-C-C family (seleno)protein [Vulcanimicrobiota bacterium]
MDTAGVLQKMRERAESCYLAGDFFCSETVLKVIHENFKTGMPDEIVSLASAFPHGVGGSGCICGALVGGTMALGMFFGRTAAKDDEKVKKAMELSHELHNIFKERNKVTCCRVLTKNLKMGSPERRAQCARLAAEMTEEAAKIILREKGADVLKQ